LILIRSRRKATNTVTTASSLPVSTILRTVWDDLGELSVRLRSQSIIACASAAFFALIGAIRRSSI